MHLRTPLTILAIIAAVAALFVFTTVVWGQVYTDFIYLILLLPMTVFAGANVYSLFFGAPYVPMNEGLVEEMIRLAGIGPGDRVADLGSGDGRVLIAAAKKGAMAEGWEINPIIWIFSVWNIHTAGVSRLARAHLGSYWSIDLGRFNVVTLYLITAHMLRMQEKLRTELSVGSRVVSCRFTFPDWQQEAVSGDGEKMSLYRR
jgi:hypothetical protein